MKISTYVAGPIDANNYLLYDDLSNEAVLIDCSDYRSDIIEEVKNKGLNVKYILLTHGHFDHVLGVNKMAEALEARVGVHKDDVFMMDNIAELSMYFGILATEAQKHDFLVEDGDTITIGNMDIQVIHTPGHTKGGVCYLVDNKLFCGDTVFKGSYGRTDLPGGNFEKIKKSIQNIIFKLDDSVEIYPGHGMKTTVEYEKKFNEINL